MATPKNPQVFFVGIQNTKDLKRAVIESTRDTIVFLQKFEKFLRVRKEKNDAVEDLKKRVKEVTSMTNQLKKILPESEIHRKLSKDEISVEEQILGAELAKKREDSQSNSEKELKAKKASVTRKKNNSNQKPSTKNNNKTKEKSKKEEPSEMDKLESQLKELESQLKGFE